MGAGSLCREQASFRDGLSKVQLRTIHGSEATVKWMPRLMVGTGLCGTHYQLPQSKVPEHGLHPSQGLHITFCWGGVEGSLRHLSREPSDWAKEGNIHCLCLAPLQALFHISLLQEVTRPSCEPGKMCAKLINHLLRLQTQALADTVILVTNQPLKSEYTSDSCVLCAWMCEWVCVHTHASLSHFPKKLFFSTYCIPFSSQTILSFLAIGLSYKQMFSQEVDI